MKTVDLLFVSKKDARDVVEMTDMLHTLCNIPPINLHYFDGETASWVVYQNQLDAGHPIALFSFGDTVSSLKEKSEKLIKKLNSSQIEGLCLFRVFFVVNDEYFQYKDNSMLRMSQDDWFLRVNELVKNDILSVDETTSALRYQHNQKESKETDDYSMVRYIDTSSIYQASEIEVL